MARMLAKKIDSDDGGSDSGNKKVEARIEKSAPPANVAYFAFARPGVQVMVKSGRSTYRFSNGMLPIIEAADTALIETLRYVSMHSGVGPTSKSPNSEVKEISEFKKGEMFEEAVKPNIDEAARRHMFQVLFDKLKRVE